MPDLAELIRQELALLDRFALLLTNEQDVLRAGKIDELPAITRSKAALIESLNQSTHARQQHLAHMGFPLDQSALEAWSAQHPQEAATRKQWETLIIRARAVRNQNDFNGQMVKQQLHSTNEALAILGSAAQQNALYGPGGQSSALSGSRRIIDSA